MPRKKKQVLNIDDRSRYIKLLLYPDNDKHLKAYENIVHGTLLDCKTYNGYIGICHKLFDDDGNVISTGQGKEHWHIWLSYSQPKPIIQLCRKFEFYLDEVGTPDDKFVRAFDGDLKSGLPYLTHLSTPAKEQYSRSDLFGTPELLDLYDKAALDYLTKKFDVRDGLRACMGWIDEHSGFVSARDFLVWLIDTPYIRLRNDRAIWSYIDAHNDALYRNQREDYITQVSHSALRWKPWLDNDDDDDDDVDFAEMSDEEFARCVGVI